MVLHTGVQNEVDWCPKCLPVMLNDSPKCRSAALAQEETMGPMGLMGEGCPKCICGCPEWPIGPMTHYENH